MKSKKWLIFLALAAVLLLASGGNGTTGYFNDVESSSNDVLRVKIAPLFGSADSFVVLAGTGITNTGPTTITGDVGTYPTATEAGFDSVTFTTGTNHAGDAVTQGAKDDLVIAYVDAAGRPAVTVATELGGTSPVPGVYNSAAGTFGITGNLTLTGDANAVWIFQAASTLITADSSQVILSGGATAANVYWLVGSSATLGTNSIFRGNIMALTSITITTGATVYGRALARNGAVTLDTNIVVKPTP